MGRNRSIATKPDPSPGARVKRPKGAARRRIREAGLTLIEVLIAAAILGTAVLALSFYHANSLVDSRRDGQITAANQVAITIAEDWRDSIRKDDSSVRLYDDGASGTRTVTVAGVDHSGTYLVAPLRFNGGGQLVSASTGQEPHLFRVDVTVDATDDYTRTYSTLVFRNPTQ